MERFDCEKWAGTAEWNNLVRSASLIVSRFYDQPDAKEKLEEYRRKREQRKGGL